MSVGGSLSHPAAAAVTFRDVEVRFPGASRPVLQIPDLALQHGQLVSVVGPSGCGKSTLLRLIARLLSPDRGLLHWSVPATRQSTNPGSRIGFVFQDATLLPWRTAVGNVRLPTELGPLSRPVTRQQALDILQQTGLPAADADKRPAKLSGGMRMRVSLARALVTEPDLLLLDEPFAALDDILRTQLQQQVRLLHQQRQMTTVLVTHNIQEAVFMSDRVLVLSGQPAGISRDIAVKLPQQRSSGDRTSTDFAAVVRQVMDGLSL